MQNQFLNMVMDNSMKIAMSNIGPNSIACQETGAPLLLRTGTPADFFWTWKKVHDVKYAYFVEDVWTSNNKYICIYQ